MIKKNALVSTILLMAGAGMADNVSARQEYADQLKTTCQACHNSNDGNSSNVKSAAMAAFIQGGVNPGLKNFVANTISSGPANTKPVISPVNPEWNIDEGQELSIPLSVTDTEEDPFEITGKFPIGASTASPEYIATNGLHTIDFKWTPTSDQANKIHTVKFIAKETATTKKLSSKPFTVKIHVWPAGVHSNVSKLIVSTAKWKLDALTLKGKVVLNNKMLPTEKTTFLSRTDLDINFIAGLNNQGINIGNSQPITFDSKGNWSLTSLVLPASPAFSCNVSLEVDSAKVTKKIAGAPKTCIK